MTLKTPGASLAAGSLSAPSAFRLDYRDALIFLVLLFGLLVVYSGALLLPYAYLDDYYWLDHSLNNAGDIYPTLAAQGRPLNAIILQMLFRWSGGLHGMWRVRAISIVELAGMGWVFYLVVWRAGWGRARAALLAVMACLVPSTQVYVAWTTSVPLPLSGILAAAAAILTGWAQDRRGRWPAMAISAILVLVSATIYQPTAMIFWPVAAVDLFRPNEIAGNRSELKCILRRTMAYIATAGAGLFLAWCVLKYGQTLYHNLVQPGRDGFSHDIKGKAIGFIQHPLVDSLNLFRLQSTPAVAMVVGTIIVIGLICYLRGPLFFRLIMLLIGAAFVPLSYAPSLLVKLDEWSYRTQIGLAWMVLVLFWLAVNGLWRMIGRIPVTAMAAAACMSGVIAAYNVTVLIAWPQAVEQSLLRIELARADVRAASRIILLQPTWADDPVPFQRYDEFGVPSLMASWVPVPAVHLIRCESNSHPSRLRVKRIENFQGIWTQPLPPGTVLIDMRHLRDAR